jgi:hypothetical protein
VASFNAHFSWFTLSEEEYACSEEKKTAVAMMKRRGHIVSKAHTCLLYST